MTKLSDSIFQNKAITVEDANKVEILSLLTEMNDLLRVAKELHAKLCVKIQKVRQIADKLNDSDYFDSDAMDNFMDQLDTYEDAISEGLEESPLGMLSDRDLEDSF